MGAKAFGLWKWYETGPPLSGGNRGPGLAEDAVAPVPAPTLLCQPRSHEDRHPPACPPPGGPAAGK
ncbi:hypothetical protein PCANC_09146 [Puccinia coronata f. sp. avenae]|uniref:Uncharacterized protein n=1 Tax=Puccinia coronata f. sp. avenae TaxID=200324 RepID=A0A2N5VV99_9BASI|nr:hypothetical protein PCANC_09146 [Puccinia coronata f. sp. avenae]